MRNEVSYTITKKVTELSTTDSGYVKEVNFVAWNGAEAKLDIRSWSADHARCYKGITLNEEEARKLYIALHGIYGDVPIV